MVIDRGMLDYVMERIRPQLQADGGDVEVTEIDDEKGIVYVALQGACVGCPMSSLTISQGIERVLKEHVPGVERVLPDLSGQENKEIEVTVLDDDGNIAGTKKVSVDELMGEEPSNKNAYRNGGAHAPPFCYIWWATLSTTKLGATEPSTLPKCELSRGK